MIQMRFSDFMNPDRGPESVGRLAMYALVLAVVGGAVGWILSLLTPPDVILPLVVLGLVSPLAYLIREARRTKPGRQRPRRGAERTPLLPPHEEEL